MTEIPSPPITAIAKNLGALMTIWEACADLGWTSDALFAEAMLLQLASLLESHTARKTEEHQLAQIVLLRLASEPEGAHGVVQ